MSDDASRRLRAICLALPDAAEQETWGAPTYRVRGKIFALESGRDGRPSVWLKAPPGMAEVFVEAAPERFFRPPYLGGKGWVAIRLDGAPDWEEVGDLVRRSFRMVATKRLALRLAEP